MRTIMPVIATSMPMFPVRSESDAPASAARKTAASIGASPRSTAPAPIAAATPRTNTTPIVLRIAGGAHGGIVPARMKSAIWSA